MHTIPTVKNIVFDLGGVILPIEFSRTISALEEAGIADAGGQFNLGHANSIFKDYEEGLIDDETFIRKLQEQTGGQADAATLVKAWNALLLDFPAERIQLLEELGKRYQLYLFSNTNGIHHTDFHRKFSATYDKSFDDFFEKAWYSHLIKRRKPDVAAFEWILADGGLKAADTLFVDDALNNIEGAQAAGMHGFHIVPGISITDIDWNL